MSCTKVFSQWCIIPACGGRLQIEGYAAPKKDGTGPTFSVTDVVTERLGPRELKCADGNVIQLQGSIAYDVGLRAGLPAFLLDTFKDGFPPSWTKEIHDWIESMCSRVTAEQNSIEASIRRILDVVGQVSELCNRTVTPRKTVAEESHVSIPGNPLAKAIGKYLQKRKDARAQAAAQQENTVDKKSIERNRPVEEPRDSSNAPDRDRRIVVALTPMDRGICNAVLLQQQHGIVRTVVRQASASETSMMPVEAPESDGNQRLGLRQGCSKEVAVSAERASARFRSVQKKVSQNESAAAIVEIPQPVTAMTTRIVARPEKMDRKGAASDNAASSSTTATGTRMKVSRKRGSISNLVVSPQKRKGSPVATTVRTQKQKRVAGTKDITNHPPVSKVALHNENVVSVNLDSLLETVSLRTRRQMKTLDTGDHTSGPSTSKVALQGEAVASEKSSCVTRTRTRKQPKDSDERDHTSGPSAPKVALQGEAVAPEKSSSVTRARTRKQTKDSDERDHTSGPSTPKVALQGETVASEKSSSVASARTRKQTKDSDTGYHASGPSVPNVAVQKEPIASQNGKCPSGIKAPKTRKQRQNLDTGCGTSGSSAPQMALQEKGVALENVKDPFDIKPRRTRKQTKNLDTDDHTSGPSIPNVALEDAKDPSRIKAPRTRKQTKDLGVVDPTIGPSVLRASLQGKAVASENAKRPSGIKAPRTRKRTKNLDTVGGMSGSSIPKMALQEEGVASENVEGPSGTKPQRGRKQTKKLDTKDHTSGLPVPNVALENVKDPSSMKPRRTRKQTKNLDTKDHTSGPSVSKVAEKNAALENAKNPPTVKAVRTRKRTKNLDTVDGTSGPTISKKALLEEGVVSENAKGCKDAVATRTRGKTLEIKDGGTSIPKTSLQKEGVTSVDCSSIVTSVRARKEKGNSAVQDNKSGPSIIKTAPQKGKEMSEKAEGSSTVTIVRTRVRRKILETEDRSMADTPVIKAVPETRRMAFKELKDPSPVVVVRKQRKAAESKSGTSGPPTPKIVPSTRRTSPETAKVPSDSRTAVRKKQRRVAKDESHADDSDASQSAPQTKGTHPLEKPKSSPVKVRTRQKMKMPKEKSNTEHKRGRTRRIETIHEATVHDKDDKKRDVVKGSTDSKPSDTKTRSKVPSKAIVAQEDDDTLTGSLTSASVSPENDFERTLRSEAAKVTSKRRIPAKSSAAASRGSKQSSSDLANQPSKTRRARQKPPVTDIVPEGCTKGKKERNGEVDDAICLDAFVITANKGTLKRKTQVRRAAQALAAAKVSDDIFADEHGTGQIEQGLICNALVMPSCSSDDEREAAGMHTPSLSSLQCSPTRSTFSDSRSSLSSADIREADKNLYRMEKHGKKDATDMVTSTPVAPERKMKRAAFFKELTRAERKMLDLEARRNFEDSDLELDYFSDVSSTY